MEFYSFFYLLRNGLFRYAVRGIKSIIVTIGTAAISSGTIAVRTSEAGIYRDLLYTGSIYTPEIV
jgi:hypothetical protein